MPRLACWLVTVACLGLLVPGAALAQSPWTGAIAGEPNAFGLQGLLFDRTGNGVAVWQGFDPVRSPRPYSALSLRAAGGAWRRGPDIANVATVRPGVFTYAPTNLLLVQALERPDAPEQRPTFAVASGSSVDGSFGPLTQLASDSFPVAAAVNARGDAIVALDAAPVIRVAERADGGRFARPRTRSPRGASRAAVAINARGDRVVAWYRNGRIEARVRRAGREWGRIVPIGRAPGPLNSITAAVAADGRTLVGWGGYSASEGHPGRADIRLARRGPRGGPARWTSWRLERIRTDLGRQGNGRVLPRFDDRDRGWVAWTGVVAGHSVVKVARVAGRTIRTPAALSGPDSLLDDFATGAQGRLGLSWTAAPGPGMAGPQPFARLTAPNGTWGPAVPLAAAGQATPGETRIAFDPVARRASVAWLLNAGPQGQLVVSTEAP